VLAVNGKSLRDSGHGSRRQSVPWLAVMGHWTRQVLGQVDVDDKTNEIPMLNNLLDPLDTSGNVVIVDALHTPPETSRSLVEDKSAHDIVDSF